MSDPKFLLSIENSRYGKKKNKYSP